MLDGTLRRLIDPPLDAAGRRLARRGVGADAVTLAGLAAGLAAGAAIAAGWLAAALALVALSRLADGLDGAVARATRLTDRGGYLDIVCDFAFYAAVPLGFAVADPAANAVAAAALLAAFYINGGTFLAFAAMAARRGQETAAQGRKSLYYSAGLAEGAETIAVFVAMCLFPAAFPWLALGFAAVTLWTAGARSVIAWRSFG